MFCTRVAWVCLVCLRLCEDEGSSPVSLQLLRGGIWACMRFAYICLCWALEWGLMLANLHISGIMLVLGAVFNMLASPRGPMCFRCLMFNLSGHCDLLFFYFVLLPLGPELW